MSNTINDLRTHLFDTIRGLTSKQDPMDLERAKAICETAQVIINSAKVEVEMVKATGGKGSGFIPEEKPAAVAPALPEGVVEKRPGLTVTRHRLAG